jgi:hypothetical protein
MERDWNSGAFDLADMVLELICRSLEVTVEDLYFSCYYSTRVSLVNIVVTSAS